MPNENDTKNDKKNDVRRVTISLSDEEYNRVLELRDNMKVRTIASTIRECINISKKVQEQEKLETLKNDIETEALRNKLRDLKDSDDRSAHQGPPR